MAENLSAISRPIPSRSRPERMSVAPLSGGKTAIAPTASPREGPDRVSGGTRGAHPVRTRVNFDSRLRDEQSEHADGESLLSQDPALTAEAWGPQRFRFATVAGDTGVEYDETCARVSFLPVASTSPRRSSPPVRRPMHHLKFLAVAKVEAVRPVHLAELLTCPRRGPSACRRKNQVAGRRQPPGRRARSAGS